MIEKLRLQKEILFIFEHTKEFAVEVIAETAASSSLVNSRCWH
jgi:hypothetical protein